MTDVDIETESICLPVTALHVLECESRTLLLIAQGPFVSIRDANTKQKYATCRVFELQAIHSIDSSPLRVDARGEWSALVILTGGSQFAFCRIHLCGNGAHAKLLGLPPRVLESRRSYADDWILKTYHHPAESNHPAFAMLMANNQLIYMQPETESTQLMQGPEVFLHAGDVTSDGADRLLIASGSAFGEVLFRSYKRDSCKSWIVDCMRRFKGHKGSIFGVSISDEFILCGQPRRLVASCSDDRRINVWDVSISEDQAALTSSTTSQTGFGSEVEQSRYLSASGTGHASRILDVQILTLQQDAHHVRILSRGEDATCQLWQFQFSKDASKQRTPALLAQMGMDHCHSGKSLWSWTQWEVGGVPLVFTGGADGRTTVRRVATDVNMDQDSVPISSIFRELALPASSFKEYFIIQPGRFLALSARGEILCGARSREGQWNWSVVRKAAESGEWRLAADGRGSVGVAASSHSILVWLSGIEEPREVAIEFPGPIASLRVVGVVINQVFVLASFSKSLPSTVVRVSTDIDAKPDLSLVWQLPNGFVVSSAAIDMRTSLLVLGSRSGSLAVYDGWNSTHRSYLGPDVQESVHGSNAVTAIQILHGDDCMATATCIVTTGRDGTYAIHRFQFDHPSSSLSFSTIHRSSPPFGPNIEGAVVCPTGKDIVLYGFKSTSFVAYSITKSSTILSLDCGGTHRSWAYQHSFSTNNETFVWTKAGAVNIYASTEAAHEIVQQGGHGREIKALAVSSKVLVSSQASSENAAMIATGAEDTTIRLFALPSRISSTAPDLSTLHCLATLSDHTTGPQHLSFSPCGTYLFSSGGCEQFHVYKLTCDVPVLQLGVVLQDIMPTTKDDEDVRIMSFEVYQARFSVGAKPPSKPSWEIVMAYSNGKAKHILYTPSRQPRKGHFAVLSEVILGSFCLMRALILTSFPTKTASSNDTQSLLTAGTNGFLNITTLATHIQMSIAMHAKHIHQSSILSVATTEVTQTSHLVVTGGDDNALGFTLLMMPESPKPVRFQTVLVPKAHSAAVTALTIVSHTRENSGGEGDWKAKVLIVTCACDQRVKLWEVTVDAGPVGSGDGPLGARGPQMEMLEHIQVRRIWESWTCVGDVSDVGLVRWGGDENPDGQTGRWVEVVVVGVGMEVLRLRIGIGWDAGKSTRLLGDARR